MLALLEARLSRTLKDKLQDSVALLRKSKRNGKISAKRHNGRNQAASAYQFLHYLVFILHWRLWRGRVSKPPLPDTVSSIDKSAHSGLRIRGYIQEDGNAGAQQANSTTK